MGGGQALVVQTFDSAIHRINRHTVNKYYGNQLLYPLDRDLSFGQRYPPFEQLTEKLGKSQDEIVN